VRWRTWHESSLQGIGDRGYLCIGTSPRAGGSFRVCGGGAGSRTSRWRSTCETRESEGAHQRPHSNPPVSPSPCPRVPFLKSLCRSAKAAALQTAPPASAHKTFRVIVIKGTASEEIAPRSPPKTSSHVSLAVQESLYRRFIFRMLRTVVCAKRANDLHKLFSGNRHRIFINRETHSLEWLFPWIKVSWKINMSNVYRVANALCKPINDLHK